MNVEWDIPHELQTPAGNLVLGTPDAGTGRCYLIHPDGYEMGPTLRVTNDNKSQADGAVLHPRYKTGTVVMMTVSYAVFALPLNAHTKDYEPACGAVLRAMDDALMEVLDSIRELTTSAQRLLWTPTGFGGDKMLDDVQVLAWPVASRDGPETLQTFSLESPWPYGITATQDDTTINNGSTVAVPNAGTTDTYPVFKVYGAPSTAFTITDVDTGLKIVYDGTRPGAIAVPGAGNYAEIDTFRGTIFLNGSSTDLIAGVDPTQTDFFTITKGGDSLSLTGAGGGAVLHVLSNSAWA